MKIQKLPYAAIAISLLLGALFACDHPGTKENSLERYINEPKQKSRDVKAAVESGQNSVRDMAKDLEDQ